MTKKWLNNFDIKVNYNLKNLSWFKIGGTAQYFYMPTSVADLQNLLTQLPADINITVLGAGSNILITQGVVKGLVIKLNYLNNIVVLNSNTLLAEAGVSNLTLANFAASNNITGLEFLSGIPGSIGGGIAMNAGAFGSEFKDIVKDVTILTRNAQLQTISNQQMGFSYRANALKNFAIFITASININLGNKLQIDTKMAEIKQMRLQNQPNKVLTGGSTFANPTGYKAWELIDKAGLRGFTVGGAKFSEKHCNFIVNFNNASFNDVYTLITTAQQQVYKLFNIKLKPEIKIIQ